ncbi:hypothetical protein GN958_ATG02785 [Phytophthora infestans]|uniref:Uncharacterized protein n=1 Tax=Phytophthora infestans TaxID=4787 RepID=A0A8S9V490_PHYIN|nr:hypothetical protein GN958_ATG02785 [Phytophthora infestans]
MLYGMKEVGLSDVQFPVSSYAGSLFADQCGENVIADLAGRLNASDNPSVDIFLSGFFLQLSPGAQWFNFATTTSRMS